MKNFAKIAVTLGALAAGGCHHTPAATPAERAAMGPQIQARIGKLDPTVKAEITGAQSEHLALSGEGFYDDMVERLAFKGIMDDLCGAGFVDVNMSDRQAWKYRWKC